MLVLELLVKVESQLCSRWATSLVWVYEPFWQRHQFKPQQSNLLQIVELMLADVSKRLAITSPSMWQTGQEKLVDPRLWSQMGARPPPIVPFRRPYRGCYYRLLPWKSSERPPRQSWQAMVDSNQICQKTEKTEEVLLKRRIKRPNRVQKGSIIFCTFY